MGPFSSRECSGLMTWEQANAFCETYGARLCTKNQLENNEAKGAGCQYNSERIWSSTECSTGFMTGFMTAAGSTGFASSLPTKCTKKSANTAYARCCADGAQDYYCFPDNRLKECSRSSCTELGCNILEKTVRSENPTMCSETVKDPSGGCSGASGLVTWYEADAFCKTYGARLCTRGELETNEAKGSGCQYNNKRIWSSTQCSTGSDPGYRDSDGYMTAAGSIGYSSSWPTECTEKESTNTAYARCCADSRQDYDCFPESETSGSCFHGSGTVLLQSGSSVLFSELRLGDIIATSNAQGGFSFSPVVKLPHAINNTEHAGFLTLTTETGKKLEMTSDHYIPKCEQTVVTAGELAVGDCLITIDGKETLVEVSWTEKSGVYTAVTEDKFIVVDSIVASSYSKNYDPKKPAMDYEKYHMGLKQIKEQNSLT
eukprot:CAMPEP_0171705404 /NCGR_PEP_ID=MMETSP0991-20121206/13172_1 /TAXON_ID=483369 /ORGANISM="non described non described, Strain CCMP2098" /LENGTH=429 /DNA_ID=CAMNT_0012294933 /DNA_START=464 /DNA_END=1754 /DNA_ORIENTATION=-